MLATKGGKKSNAVDDEPKQSNNKLMPPEIHHDSKSRKQKSKHKRSKEKMSPKIHSPKVIDEDQVEIDQISDNTIEEIESPLGEVSQGKQFQ